MDQSKVEKLKNILQVLSKWDDATTYQLVLINKSTEVVLDGSAARPDTAEWLRHKLMSVADQYHQKLREELAELLGCKSIANYFYEHLEQAQEKVS